GRNGGPHRPPAQARWTFKTINEYVGGCLGGLPGHRYPRRHRQVATRPKSIGRRFVSRSARTRGAAEGAWVTGRLMVGELIRSRPDLTAVRSPRRRSPSARPAWP